MSDSVDPPERPRSGPGEQSGSGWRIADRYLVTGRVGSGGMADVLRARDELLQRDVAIKIFRSQRGAADDAAGAERQRAELLALARLNHPHLITLYDGAIPDDGPAYLVMELIEGPTLGDRIARGPLLAEHEVRVVGAQVAEALAYVHDVGMVHRDVKPANILLGTSPGGETPIRARLSDFGIVRLLGAERLTSVDSTLGTASYLAPEQARGSGVGPAADVYALGLTLIEALTGVRSFDGETPIEAVVARLDRDPHIPQHLPAPWPGLLAAMTARNPDARPSAAQVASALRTGADSTTQFIAPVPGADAGTTVIPAVAAAGAMPPVRPPSPPSPVSAHRPPPPPKKRNIGLIVGLVLALVLIALGATILIATTAGNDSPGSTSSPTPSRTSHSTRATTSNSQPPSTQTDESKPTKNKKTKTKPKTKSKSKSTSTSRSTPPPSDTEPVPSVTVSPPSDSESP